MGCVFCCKQNTAYEMRISDWSSDVCSSDLGGDMKNVKPGIDYIGRLHKAGSVLRVEGTTHYAKFVKGEIPVWISSEHDGLKADRKSVVKGTSVSVSVDLSGRRIIQQNKTYRKHNIPRI